MIYLDNAATTFPKPPAVIDEVLACISSYCGNPGRSSHKLSLKCAEAIYEARELLGQLVGIDAPENIVFTENATYALNIALKCSISENSHVIISDIEHNSVIRPLESLKKSKNLSYSIAKNDGKIFDNITSLINDKTAAVVCNLTSNVNGEEIPLDTLSSLCRSKGLKLIVDASQKIGHSEINLKDTPCDILCAPAHKALFGIQGAGFLIFGENIPELTFVEGGNGIDTMNKEMPMYLPERYEAGTLPTPSIVALREGIKFILDVGIKDISAHLCSLTEYALMGLSQISSVEYLGGEGGVVSFTLKNHTPSQISAYLSEFDICTRSGYHCAPLIHGRLGTERGGTVRASFSFFNKTDDVDALIYRLSKI